MSKATPKAGITLFSRDDGKLKFAHSPSASGDVAIKHKLGQKLTLGLGFTVSRQRGPGAGSSGPRRAARPPVGPCTTVEGGERSNTPIPCTEAGGGRPTQPQDSTVRQIKSIPGLVLSGDLKVGLNCSGDISSTA